MTELIEALRRADLGHGEAAGLLRCSPSAARMYIAELVDAGVAEAVAKGAGCKSALPLYRITSDPGALSRYQLTRRMHATASSGKAQARASDNDGAPAHDCTARLPTCGGPAFAYSDAPVRRDPLVEALFGRRQAVPPDVACQSRPARA